MKLSEKQMAFSHKVGIFILWIYTHPGWTVTIGEVLRPQKLQDIYYKEGKTKTLYSKHTKKLAIDLNLFKDGRYITNKEKYRPLGEFWEKCLEGRWGGRFGVKKKDYDKKVGWDARHFEYFK